MSLHAIANELIAAGDDAVIPHHDKDRVLGASVRQIVVSLYPVTRGEAWKICAAASLAGALND